MSFPYKLYDGATRPDAITGLDPAFSSALTRMYYGAPASVQAELGLSSAYRSRAVQQKLWDASDKTGHTVAAPGRSRHNFGGAADLQGFGLGKKRTVSDETFNWVHGNAQNYGMAFPMDYEPWHIQMAGPAGQAGPGASRVGPPTPAPPTDPMSGYTPTPQAPRPDLFSGDYGMADFGRDILTGRNPLREAVYSRIGALFGI